MFTTSSPKYVNNICHRILGFLFLCSLTREVSSTLLWPAGRYGLPMPNWGCPKSNGFTWKMGGNFQDLENTNSLTSASPNFHLYGLVDNDVMQHYCIKNDASAAVDSKRSRWPAGEYCIYQKGPSCPAGLLSGSVLWDDENGPTGTNLNSKAGMVPEGVYNQDTKIFFCCTGTGSRYDPIKLPVSSPFYLIAFTPRCQEVLNTVHTMEYITYDTENDNNHDQKTFPYPYGVSQLNPTIYYCYYKECAWTMTALSGTFWSPYYPQDYTSGHSCKWRINVPWNYTISVTFGDVTLQQSCCQCDYVELWETVTNGSEVLIGTFCDETKPDPSYQFRSTDNNVTVIFYSDARVQAKGFNASYKAIPVPGHTTTSTIVPTSNSNGTRTSTTIPTKNGSTTSTFTHISPVTLEPTTGRGTTSGSSYFSKNIKTSQAKNNRASTGSAFVFIGVIGSFIVIGVALAGTLYWFCKKRNIKKNNNDKSKLTVSFTTSNTTCGMTNISSYNMHQGIGFVSNEEDNDDYAKLEIKEDTCIKPVKESDNPMYERDCLVTAVTYNDEGVKKSDNPIYVRDSPVVSGKARYTNVGKGSENLAYENDYLETSAKKGYEEEIKQSENPLYASSPETDNQSENQLYESMDDNFKGTVEDGIYSSLYKRMVSA